MVSVVLPVYNGASFISEAINSILNQTFKDFELLIINDGCTDESEKVIKDFNDPRIRYFSFKKNRGLVASLNFGLETAQGKYIARIDADDISAHNRIEEQVRFLENFPEYVFLGSSVELIPSGQMKHPPLIDQEIAIGLVFNNVFFHSTIMFRSELVNNHGLRYKDDYLGCEDYQLWTEVIRFGKARNLVIPGMKYRIHSNQVSKNKPDSLKDRLNQIRESYLINLGIGWNEKEFTAFNHFCNSEQMVKNEIYILINCLSDLNQKFSKKYAENSGQILEGIFTFLLMKLPQKKFMMSIVYNTFLNQMGIKNSRMRLKLIKQDVKYLLNK
ncbi:glycosyl transferase family 2 [Algoriphagus yeomjeoni]|uniref:Glycosyl transferase family 2 n=1 Tax=Algoriphagus yeomjeoni TaxID=291403 RepID=A0A327P034_9BACT|nr:glycosyl transferase family 2 [Algoriphagus yeomjeoni]